MHKSSAQDACRTRSRARQVVLRGGLPPCGPQSPPPRHSSRSVSASPRRPCARRGPADTDVETLAIVVASHSATLGNGIASDGATLYNGDRLVTAPNGGLSLRSGDAMLYMSGSTQVTLHRSQSHNPVIKKSLIRADVTSGSVSFSLSPDQYFLVSAQGALIGPAAPMPTLGEITILDARSFEIRARRGPLKIVYCDDSEFIPEGKSYRVELDDGPDSTDPDAALNQNARPPRRPPPLHPALPHRHRRRRRHRRQRRLRPIRRKPRLPPTQPMQPPQLTQAIMRTLICRVVSGEPHAMSTFAAEFLTQ